MIRLGQPGLSGIKNFQMRANWSQLMENSCLKWKVSGLILAKTIIGLLKIKEMLQWAGMDFWKNISKLKGMYNEKFSEGKNIFL